MQIRKLNFLRALAALIVFVTHFSDETHWMDGMLGGGAGAYGVMLFFMLSGFLMAYLYLQTQCNSDKLKRYMLARIGRVVPLFLLVVLCSYGLTLMGKNYLYHIPDVHHLLGHLLFLSGDSVLWSIPPEVQFYLVFILFWWFANDRKGYIYLSIAAVLLLLFFTNFPRVYGEIAGVPYNQFNVMRSLPFFFIGVLMGLHYKSTQIPTYMKSHWFVFALCLIPLMYPELSPVTSDAKRRMWLSYEVLLVMSCVFFCVVFLVPDTNRLLANSVGDFIGKISYSLYLLHLPIIQQVNQWPVPVLVKLLLSLLLSVLVAYVSYRYFEKPIAKLIRKGADKKSTCTENRKVLASS